MSLVAYSDLLSLSKNAMQKRQGDLFPNSKLIKSFFESSISQDRFIGFVLLMTIVKERAQNLDIEKLYNNLPVQNQHQKFSIKLRYKGDWQECRNRQICFFD